MYIKYYPLIWLKREHDSKDDTKENSTNAADKILGLSEYKRRYTKKKLERIEIYLINLPKSLTHNPIYFWIKLSIFSQNLKT